MADQPLNSVSINSRSKAEGLTHNRLDKPGHIQVTETTRCSVPYLNVTVDKNMRPKIAFSWGSGWSEGEDKGSG